MNTVKTILALLAAFGWLWLCFHCELVAISTATFLVLLWRDS